MLRSPPGSEQRVGSPVVTFGGGISTVVSVSVGVLVSVVAVVPVSETSASSPVALSATLVASVTASSSTVVSVAVVASVVVVAVVASPSPGPVPSSPHEAVTSSAVRMVAREMFLTSGSAWGPWRAVGRSPTSRAEVERPGPYGTSMRGSRMGRATSS